MRRRAGTRTFTSILANAHTQDFVKKRKPGAGDGDKATNLKDGSFDDEDGRAGSSDDEDDDDDTHDVLDAHTLLRESRVSEEAGGASD